MATRNLKRKGAAATKPSPSKFARKKASEKVGNNAGRDNLAATLGSFADARSVIETVCHSLENCDDYNDAASALRTGVRMFSDAYNQLDRAINRLSGSRPTEKGRPAAG